MGVNAGRLGHFWRGVLVVRLPACPGRFLLCLKTTPSTDLRNAFPLLSLGDVVENSTQDPNRPVQGWCRYRGTARACVYRASTC